MTQTIKSSCVLTHNSLEKYQEPKKKNKLKKNINSDLYTPDQVIKSVGCYTILNKLLGNSYFSLVYYGVNDASRKPVAIKIIKNNCLTSSSVENELLLLNKIKNSRRIVKMETNFTDLYNFYMVFELADFNLLDFFSANVEMFSTEKVISKFFRKIASAVKELHEYGIAHRDIKMENILFFSKICKKSGMESFRIKLADLGLSKNCDKNKKFNDYCGSPIYSAPEVNMGISYDGFKYDIWNLGIILYYLKFGCFPFNVFEEEVCDDSDESENIIKKKIIDKLFYKIQNDELNFDSDKNCSEELKSLIITLLKKNPEDRPIIEEVLSHPWLINNVNYH
jgi:serine/threonine protein kinase